MKQKRQAPGVRGRRAGALSRVQYKGKEFYLNNNEFRVFSLLMCGGMWATFEIAERLSAPDPRSTIRYLRNMGIDVSDVWSKENKMRFKRYYIRIKKSNIHIYRMPTLFDCLKEREEVSDNG